jgi:ribonuclease VapC
MFVDASALVAVLLHEPERAEIEARLTGCKVLVSAVTVWEASRAVAKALSMTPGEAGILVRAYLELLDCETVPIAEAEELLAVQAADRFGKGRHPAKLNMGDCFSYACARVHGVPLLYKGGDFALTDIEPA